MFSSSESDSDIEFIDNLRAPKERQFKDRPDYCNILDGKDFLRRFRLSKQTFTILLEKIRLEIQPKCSSSSSQELETIE